MTLGDAVAPTTAPIVLSPVEGLLLDGRYRLELPLGRGGMASVWRAHDTCLARDVAVKIFDRPTALEEDFAARHSMEVRLLARLSHRGVVGIYDAQRVDDTVAYLVMELVDGKTLRQLLAGGPLLTPTVRAIGIQLADALAYVHSRGIVHRDVKPANVLIADDDHGEVVAKITDFGVARMLDGNRLTVEGTTVGTANYLSPEQATGREVGPASDIYSLGLVLLEALTGTAAYPGHGVEAALARLSRQPAIPERLEQDWGALLRAMTAFDPADRPDAAQVAGELRAIAAGRAGSIVVPPAVAVAASPLEGAPLEDAPSGPRTALHAPAPLAGPVARRHRTTWVASGAAMIGALGAALLMLAIGVAGHRPVVPSPAATPLGAVKTHGATSLSQPSLMRDIQAAPMRAATTVPAAKVTRARVAPAAKHHTARKPAPTKPTAAPVKHKPAPPGPPGRANGHGHKH